MLQKVGSPRWRQLYYPVLRGEESDRSKIALRFGLSIAEAHIATMARDAQKIRDIANDLQRHAKVLGIGDALSDKVALDQPSGRGQILGRGRVRAGISPRHD